MSAALIVFGKEVRENLRDRRTLLSALITGPLLLPLLVALTVQIEVSRMHEKADAPLRVPVVGAERAPGLMRSLTALGLDARPAIDDPEAAVTEQREDVVLRIPADYAEHFRAGKPAEVEIVYDASRRDDNGAVDRLRKMLESIDHREAAMRLVARGISPAVAAPLAIVDRDVSTAQSRSQIIFNMLPYLFLMTVLVGGMYMAIDTTAGERERQSLEPLFANPATRTQILTGKLCATFAFSLVSLCLSMAAFSVAGRFMPIDELGMVLDIGPRFAGLVLLLMLPMVVLLGTLQTLLSAFAKSFREAQTYLSLLMLLLVIPSFLLGVIPQKGQLWMYGVPLLGQQLGITRVLRGEPLTALQIVLCFGSTLVVALLAAAVTARVYRSERLAIST